MGHMHSDLVGTAGLKTASDQRSGGAWIRFAGFPPAFKGRIMGHGRPALILLNHRHFLPILRTARNRPAQGPASWPKGAPGQGQVRPLNIMAGKKIRQTLMCGVRLGDRQNTGRILVDPMHDTGPLHTPDPRQCPLTVVQKRIHQRSGPAAGRRVNSHVGRLIHQEKMLVLKQDIEYNRFRFRRRRNRIRQIDPVTLSGHNTTARVLNHNVGICGHRRNRAGLNQAFQSCPGKIGYGLGQEPVKTKAAMPTFNICNVLCHNRFTDLFSQTLYASRPCHSQSRSLT